MFCIIVLYVFHKMYVSIALVYINVKLQKALVNAKLQKVLEAGSIERPSDPLLRL